jgi:hypothetical protein
MAAAWTPCLKLVTANLAPSESIKPLQLPPHVLIVPQENMAKLKAQQQHLPA